MSQKIEMKKSDVKEYDRLMLRAAVVSVFWSVITDLKKRRSYRLQELADEIGVDKSAVSRWFSGHNPNWTLNTISDIANALNVDVKIVAIDRRTKMIIHTPQGPQSEVVPTTTGSFSSHQIVYSGDLSQLRTGTRNAA
jgi:transcriptional regulator with XRE-family HTH domain